MPNKDNIEVDPILTLSTSMNLNIDPKTLTINIDEEKRLLPILKFLQFAQMKFDFQVVIDFNRVNFTTIMETYSYGEGFKCKDYRENWQALITEAIQNPSLRNEIKERIDDIQRIHNRGPSFYIPRSLRIKVTHEELESIVQPLTFNYDVSLSRRFWIS